MTVAPGARLPSLRSAPGAPAVLPRALGLRPTVNGETPRRRKKPANHLASAQREDGPGSSFDVSSHPRRERRLRIDIDDENAVSKCGKFRREITSQGRFGDSTLLVSIFLLSPKRDLGEAQAGIVALLDTKIPRATNIDGRRIHLAKRRPR